MEGGLSHGLSHTNPEKSGSHIFFVEKKGSDYNNVKKSDVIQIHISDREATLLLTSFRNLFFASHFTQKK